MWSVLLVFAVGLLAWVWVRGVRHNRRKWLRSVNLPGLWHWQSDDGSKGNLELWGELSGGGYRLEDRLATQTVKEQGTWRLEGSLLLLQRESGAKETCDLRVFDGGKIGLDCPSRPRRIYARSSDNVVSIGSRRG